MNHPAQQARRSQLKAEMRRYGIHLGTPPVRLAVAVAPRSANGYPGAARAAQLQSGAAPAGRKPS